MRVLRVVLPLLLVFRTCVAGLYGSSSPVRVLDAATFQKSVKNGNLGALVEFFSSTCGHCKAFASEYERAAKALQGLIRTVAVEDQTAMGSEGIQGFPTVKLYLGKGQSPVEYKGSRTADGLVAFVLKEISTVAKSRLGNGGQKKKGSTSDVIELTEQNFDKLVLADAESVWFVEFFAPWCGHCKALAPTWETVATALQGKVKVGKVDATVHTGLAHRFGVQGFPTLQLFPAGKKLTSSAVPYNGPRDEGDLVNFALQFTVEAVKAEQLTSNDEFVDKCQKGVCVISILPDLLDTMAAGRKKYIDILNRASRVAATMPVKFFWLEGGTNFDFEEALHLQFGYPAVLAINLEKQKYGVHKGHFTEEALRSFVTGLISGRQTLNTIPKNLPPLAKTEKWDGKDPVITPEVDESSDEEGGSASAQRHDASEL